MKNRNSSILGLVICLPLLHIFSSVSAIAQVSEPGWILQKGAPVTPEDAEVYLDGAAVNKEAEIYEPLMSAQPNFRDGTPMPEEFVAFQVSALKEANKTDIQLQAQGLRNDPVRIFNFVSNHIDYDPYFGSLKGASLTLLDRNGNDFDQSSLLYEMLVEAGFAPEYVYGTMNIPVQGGTGNRDIIHWLGITENGTNAQIANTALSMIADGGIPVESLNINNGNDVDFFFRIARVWIKVEIDGVTHHLDPAFKRVKQNQSEINLEAASGFNKEALLNIVGGTVESASSHESVSGLSIDNLNTQLTTYTSNLINTVQNDHFSDSVDEVLSRYEIDPYEFSELPTIPWFPFTVREVWNEIPAQYLHTARLQHSGIVETLPIKNIAGKKLALHHEGLLTTRGTQSRNCDFISNAFVDWEFGSFYQSEESNTFGCFLPSSSSENIIYRVRLTDSDNGAFKIFDNNGNEFDEQRTFFVSPNEEVSFSAQLVGFSESQEVYLNSGNKVGRISIEITNGFTFAGGRDSVEIILNGQIADEPKAVFTLDDEPIFELDNPTYQNTILLDEAANTEEVNGWSRMLRLSVDHPYSENSGTFNDQTTDYSINRGALYVIGSSFGQIDRSTLLEKRQNRLQQILADNTATDIQRQTEALHVMGQTWITQSNATNTLLADLSNIRITKPHRFGLIGQEEGYFVDFKTQVTTINSRTPDSPLNIGSFPAKSFFRSALEHGVPEQLQGVENEVASTISILTDAIQNGDEVLLLTDIGAAEEQMLLDGGYSQEFIDIRNSEIGPGPTVFDYMLIPQKRTPINNWDGFGFVGFRGESNELYSGLTVFMAIGGELEDIPLGGGFATNPAPINPPRITNDFQLDSTPSSLSFSNADIGGCPINFNTGDKIESITDMIAGGLSFRREYNSRNNNELSSIGVGWRHNLDIQAQEHSDENSALGGRAVSDMAPILVSQLVTLRLMEGTPTAQEWTIAALVNDWAMDQLQDNAVTIRSATAADTFIRMPDGSFNPPPQNTSTLTQENGVYILTSRFGTVTRFNNDNKILSVSDIDGNQVSYTYNNEQLISVQDNFNNQLTLAYEDDLLSSVTDHTNRQVTYQYLNNQLESVIDVANETWRYEYDLDQRLERQLDPLDQIIKQVDYDELGRVEVQSWPRQAGLSAQQYLYAPFETNIIDELGHSFITSFDDQRRTFLQTNALGQSVKSEYDGQSRVVSIKDPLGRESRTEFDKNNNITSTTNALDETTTFDYDDELRLRQTTDPIGNISIISYDTEHHPTTNTVFPTEDESITVTSTYFPNGQIKTVTDARGTVTSTTYDASGNSDLTQASFEQEGQIITEPAIDRDFDSLGRLESLTDQEGAKTTFTYDLRDNVKTITDPQDQVTTMTYDELGRLNTLTDRNQDTSTISYTVSGQIDNIDYPGTNEDVSFTYDLRDQVRTMTDGLGQTLFDYDELGRLEQTTDPNGFVVQYAYDIASNLKTLTYPGGKVVSYTYDAANRLKTLTNWLNQTVTYNYDAAGRLELVTNANGTVTEYRYDNANRLFRLTNKQSTGEVITEQVFVLDGNGNPTEEFKIQPQAPQEIASELGHQYNLQRTRLESVTDIGDNEILNQFVYDDEGQQTQKDDDVRSFDTRNRLTSQGNRTYQYDANNNRLVIQENAQTVYHIFDASNNLLAEANENKEITRYYIHVNGLNQMIQGNQAYTYHHSNQGHVLAMTDENEEVVNQYAYSPFGRIIGETEAQGLEQPFKYVGQFGVQHEQNEIYYMRARYYDAETGRFLKEDPIGFDGGLNVSLYVNGNPVVGIDPSGLVCVPCIGAGVGFIFEAGSQIASGEFNGPRLLAATAAGALGGGLGSAISRSASLGILRTGTGRATTAGLGSAVIGGGAQTVNNRIDGRPTGEGVANAALISGIGGALGQGGGELAEELITALPVLGLRGNISGVGVAVGETIGNTISNTTTLIGSSQQCRP